MASQGSEQQQPQLTFEDINKDLPLHMAVLTSPPEMSVTLIHKAMSANPKPSINRVDNYGRTAFHLALGMNNLLAAKALLAYSPRVDIQDGEGFTAWDEVVITKDEALIRSVFKFQETDRLMAVLKGIGQTFASFAAVPDFYYELKWSITGLPLISKFIAHDTYKIFKQGHSVRIDSTLVDIKEGRILYKPITGDRSFIFLATELGATTFIDMDHQAETFTKIAYEGDESQVRLVVVENPDAFEEALAAKDVTSTRLIAEGLHAKVAKSFLTRKQKREVVDGLPCLGYDVYGVKTELKTRRESLLGQLATALEIKGDPLKYFNAKTDEEKAAADLVPARNLHTTLKSWDATVYLYEGGGGQYPYSIAQHLVPVLKLMALINPQFAKLASFLSLDIFTDRPGAVTADPGEKLDKIRKLPGFPLVIDMHVFMNIKARITVQNHTAFGVEGIRPAKGGGKGGQGRLLLEPNLFAVPTNYKQVN